MSAQFRIELFGNPRLAWRGQPVTTVNTTRLHSLLAFLVLHAGSPQPRDQLSFRLWPESTESQARTNLRQLIHHLRRALPAEACLLVSDNHTVHWPRHPSCSVDVHEFDAALAAARAHPAAECDSLELAAGLYQDDLVLAVYDDWVQPQRDRYRREFAAALARLAVLLEERRDYPAAIRHAERLVAHDPLREPHHQLLIRLHAANRDRAAALRAYHQCMRVLRRELGVDPDPATRQLFDRILKSQPAPATLAAALPSPAATLIGRQPETARLLDSWNVAQTSGPVFVVISGEPGIGKSRLAEHLYETCDCAASARARCYAGQAAAYAPIADWLRSEPLAAARARLSPAQLAELSRILPELAAQSPQPLTESWQRLHFYESLNAAFAKSDKPLLLLIDDLQWCDADSFEWLLFLFRSPAAARTLVLGTLRAEEAGRDHPVTRLLTELRRAGQLVEIPLQPLDAAQTAALASQVSTATIAPADCDELYRATRGNPLFVVETVRAGIEGATPARIHAVITARFAQLSKESYELAGFAGVIGRPFSFDLLAKATDWDEASLSRALDELWQRRIIEGHGASDYDFTHDRLREVAYAALSLVRRRFLHRRVARSLEELHAPIAQLASHYESAGMPVEAIRHYALAASQARQRYADSESALLLRRALALGHDLPETPQRLEQELDLLVALGPSLVTTQGYAAQEVGETYERARALSRRLEEKRHVYHVLSGACVYHIVRAELEVARAIGAEFLERARVERVPEVLMAGHFISAGSCFHLGRMQPAREHVEACLLTPIDQPLSVLALFAGPDLGVFARSYLGHILWHSGHPTQAVAAAGQAIDAARRVGHPFSMAIALAYDAMLHVFRADSHAALPRARKAVDFCVTHGFVYYLSMSEILAGWAAAAQGDPAAGLAELRRGLDRFRSTGAEIRLPFYLGLLAETHARNRQFGEAMANLSNAFAFQAKNGETWAAPILQRIHSEILRAGI